MSRLSLILSTGFALFSMFFGSGNLVYPLNVGKEAGDSFFSASLGFLLTGVLVPFLGAYTLLLYRGDLKKFFSGFGSQSAFWFSLIALSLMGPFGVLARCVTVAHASFQNLMPNLSLPLFSLGMLFLIYLLTLRKNRVVPFIGKLLTPILLLSLGVIVYVSLTGDSPHTGKPGVSAPFFMGLHEGYQTMDLLASFFFSVYIIQFLEKKEQDLKRHFQNVFYSGVVGAVLLASVYLFLVYLGVTHAALLTNVAQEGMISSIALALLGETAGYVTCVFISMACLTTAIVLSVLYADFLHQEAFNQKVSLPACMGLTLAIAFGISTLEFSGIAAFIGPILEMLYPALIILTLIRLFEKLTPRVLPRWPVIATLTLNIVWTLILP